MFPDWQQNAVYMIGLGVIIVIGAFIVESVRILARRAWRNGEGDRRHNDENWPRELISGLGELNGEFRSLKTTLLNGLRKDLDDIKHTIQHCERVTYMREHEHHRSD